MMNTKSHLNILIPVVSLSAAVYLLLAWVLPTNLQSKDAAFAAETKNYTTNWKASKLIRVNLNNRGTRPITIGVGEWKVTGTLPNSASVYTETWTAPGGATLSFRINGCNSSSPIGITGISTLPVWKMAYVESYTCKNRSITTSDSTLSSRYLYNYSGTEQVTFSMIDAQITKNSGQNTNNNVAANAITTGSWNGLSEDVYGAKDYAYGNGAANCFLVPYLDKSYQSNEGEDASLCAQSTGAYGFSNVYTNKNGTGNWWETPYYAFHTQGVFMPLEWTVNGVVCSDPAATECKP